MYAIMRRNLFLPERKLYKKYARTQPTNKHPIQNKVYHPDASAETPKRTFQPKKYVPGNVTSPTTFFAIIII